MRALRVTPQRPENVAVAVARAALQVAVLPRAGALPTADIAMRPSVIAYLGLGANLGDARATLDSALRRLDQTPGIVVTARSAYYRTAPMDSSGPDYTNAVAELQTLLSAPELLQCLHLMEAEAGRERPYRNAPRTLDLDILVYGDGRIDSPGLTIPHPRMGARAFVLIPLAEIAPRRVSTEQLMSIQEQAIERLP